ncbi:TRAP transporter substrate-binding protein [Aureimonas populi]|uniref:TRAP transporter substrate-binding protein n=1 Tax=Aureimonas populi TaxID=1701758 RepID=A0ABW5CMT2_9HYPH|nr:TRAP transporter substrate-binding protein [Aureimonas populi]
MTIRIAGRAFLAGAMLSCAFVATPALSQEFTFSLHHFLGPQAPAQTRMLAPWAERIEEASQGRISIELYPSMSLGGTPQELIRQARDGVVDMIWTLNGYSPGLFPRTEVFELPNVHTNDTVATNLAMADLFDEHLAQEHVGVQVLFQHVHAGQAIQMADREVRAPSDLAGTTLRIPTRTGAWVVEALGANPVSMPVPDFPQALSRGVVHGGLVPWEIIPALQLQDLTDYQIELADNGRLGTSVFQVSMNKARWDALPEDIRQIFLDHSGEDWLREVGRIWRDIDDAGIALAVEAGNNHVTLTAEESAVFVETLEPVVARWVEDVSRQGVEGAALVEAAREAIASHQQ